MSMSKRIALCGMMCALGVIFLLPSGVITVGALACPAAASVCLLPVLIETDARHALMCWAATAALGLMLCADREGALVFVFLGWYPVVKPKLAVIRSRLARSLVKLLLFNLIGTAAFLCMVYIFGMTGIMNEYRLMGPALTVAYIVILNVTVLVYDRMLTVMPLFYVRKLRPKLKGLL